MITITLANFITDPIVEVIEAVGRLIIDAFLEFVSIIPAIAEALFLSILSTLPAPTLHTFTDVLAWLPLVNSWVPLDLFFSLFWIGMQFWIGCHVVRLAVTIIK
ncbi:MAG: hypothetical protein Tsb0013_02540 [Phycisphaerales bacterium]